jgi:hypothetical protein
VSPGLRDIAERMGELELDSMRAAETLMQGLGRGPLFWKLAQSFSALYPSGSDEKQWVDGVLFREKGLG